MSAFTPIPNSLFAGAYNGDFFPHGAVTYSTRSFIVVVRQEICVDGRVDSVLLLEAVVNTRQLLEAGYVDAVPLEGQTVTLQTLEGLVVTIKPLTAISRSDALGLEAQFDSVNALEGVFNGAILLNAVYADTLPLEAEAVRVATLQAQRASVLQLTGTVEVC